MNFDITTIVILTALLYGFGAVISPDITYNLEVVWKGILFIFALELFANLILEVFN